MHARIGVVVVSYRNPDLTLTALRSILATDWPSEALSVVLVDNAADDELARSVRSELPTVGVIPSPVNRGFAGGCNLGIRALSDVDHVALVNSDAAVEPTWLRPLVAALDEDPTVGAASPKILFADEFGDLRIGSVGPSDVPVELTIAGARVDGVDVWQRIQWVEGDRGRALDAERRDARRISTDALVRVPVTAAGNEVDLLISSEEPTAIECGEHGRRVRHEIGPAPKWCRTPVGAPQRIVNNAGSELVADGYGADRGYLNADDGSFDEPGDVFAWCGAAVLLRNGYLDDVGLFDERLFLYYEDLELSWRGRSRGWRYRYVPESVVRHVHAATSVEGSTTSDYFNERNHLAVVTRHGSRSLVTRALARHLLVTGSYGRRDVVAPLLHGRRPNARVVGRRLRAYGAALRMAPAMISARRRDRRRDAVSAPRDARQSPRRST